MSTPGVGLNEFYEARRKEARHVERTTTQCGQRNVPQQVKPSCVRLLLMYMNDINKSFSQQACTQCGCCAKCARYHAYSYGTPYVAAYDQRGTSANGLRNNNVEFDSHGRIEKRSDRIYRYDKYDKMIY